MISMLVYSNNVEELKILKNQVLDIAALVSEEKWELTCFSSLKELMDFVEKQPLVNLACYDVTERTGLNYLGELRKGYRDAALMLIADGSLSPMEYVRPDILASSLILRPFSIADFRDKIRDMMKEYIGNIEDEQSNEAFVVETREGKTRIPYNQIYYMEARDKKIYIRLREKEMAFYDTLDELEQKLPEGFIRCHRSFLVNQIYVEKILLSQSEIHLSHGMMVPLSRSYKPRFKVMR